MQCSEIQENLSAYLDGELDPGEEAALKSHLEGCESCRKELESLRSTVELVRTVPRVQAPAVLKQRLTSAAASRRPMPNFQGIAGLIAAAAILLVTVVAVFLVTGPGAEPPSSTAFKTEGQKVGPVGDEEPDLAKVPVEEEAVKKFSGEKMKELDEPLVAQAKTERQKGKAGLPSRDGRGYSPEKFREDKHAPAVAEAPGVEEELREEEALKKARRALEADRKQPDRLAERPAQPEAERSLGAGERAQEPGTTGAPLAGPAAPAAEPQDTLARAKKPVEKEAVPDAGALPEEQKLADKEKAGKRVEQLVFETPDVKTTAGALKEILSAYKGKKAGQEKEGKGPASEDLELEKADSESGVYLVEVTTEEYEKLVKKLKSLEGKAAPETEGGAGRSSTRKEATNAAPGRGGGAGKAPPEAAAERRRAARKPASPPKFSGEKKKAEEGWKQEEAEQEEEGAFGEEKDDNGATPGARKDSPDDKPETREAKPKLVTVVIRIVKRDIPHARLLAREAQKEAAEKALDKGK